MERSRPAYEFGQAIKNVGIPPKTKCSVCKRVKHINQYSTKQLDELRIRIRRYGQANAVPKEGLIRCRDCTGAQNREMKCTMCLKVKPLEGFSLAQRSKKDDACHEDLDETHPDDRKLATAHDNTLAYKKGAHEEDDASSTTSGDVADIWLWNRETGDYATEGSSASRSDQGVPLPRSSASMTTDTSSIRPWTGARRPPIAASRPQGIALTRKNLAKLTISNKSDKGKSHGDVAVSSESGSSSSGSSSDVTDLAAGVPLGSEAGNFASRPSLSQPLNEERSDKPSSSKGRVFRAYDPSGISHIQRRRPSTAASDATAAEVRRGDGGWHGRTYASNRERDEGYDADDQIRAFAKVRPQNAPTRKYVDDELPAPRFLSYAAPSRAGIDTGVMENVDSDDD